MSEESLMKGNGHCSAGFKLFGVQIGGEGDNRGGVSAIRKSKSLGNLQACRSESVAAAVMPDGYLSDGLVHPASKLNERKKGKPWSIEEHRSFLAGLNRLGKGDWKGISTNFVPTRNPTQVASHAQKYFIRKAASEKRRRRTSVFDIPLNNDQYAGGSSSSRPVSSWYEPTGSSSSRPVSSWYEPTKRFNCNVRNIEEHKKGQSLLPTTTTIPVSERPPLSPRRRGISELHSMSYMPRVSAFTPTLSWVPVVNFPSSTGGVHIPNFQEPFPKCRRFMPENAVTQPGPPLSLAAADPAAHTKDELNFTIRKMTLG